MPMDPGIRQALPATTAVLSRCSLSLYGMARIPSAVSCQLIGGMGLVVWGIALAIMFLLFMLYNGTYV